MHYHKKHRISNNNALVIQSTGSYKTALLLRFLELTVAHLIYSQTDGVNNYIGMNVSTYSNKKERLQKQKLWQTCNHSCILIVSTGGSSKAPWLRLWFHKSLAAVPDRHTIVYAAAPWSRSGKVSNFNTVEQ